MTDDDDDARRVVHATRALSAYAESAFLDDASVPPDDPIYIRSLLAAMLCDLEHYAAAHGVDFTEAVAAGREVHADEIAAQKRYAVGDEVRLRLQPRQRGTVIDTGRNAAGEQTYLVKVPGLPHVREEPAVALDSAPPFPPTPAGATVITRAEEAEEALIDQAVRLRGPHTGDDRHLYETVLDALAGWSGTTAHELLADLAPRIAHRAAEPRKPPSPAAVPAKLAARGFPADITKGLPPCETPHSAQVPLSPPADRNRRTA
ncbi:hypothetical protein ACIBF1_08635 [Spirillospora sp. NPDC050679]